MTVQIVSDPNVSTLDKCAESCSEWFVAICNALQEDVAEFNRQSTVFPFAHEVLKVQLEFQLGEDFLSSSRLRLSTAFSSVVVIANHPPGWLYVELSKQSPAFDGILHRGAIRIISTESRSDLELVGCEWMGEEQPESSPEIAALLVSQLLDPQFHLQLEAAKGTSTGAASAKGGDR